MPVRVDPVTVRDLEHPSFVSEPKLCNFNDRDPNLDPVIIRSLTPERHESMFDTPDTLLVSIVTTLSPS